MQTFRGVRLVSEHLTPWVSSQPQLGCLQDQATKDADLRLPWSWLARACWLGGELAENKAGFRSCTAEEVFSGSCLLSVKIAL